MKKVVITGVNSTLGKYVAKEFSSTGWQVFGTTRNISGAKHQDEIYDKIHLMELDLASSSSIEQFCKTLFSKENKIDVLINNAGHVLSGPFEGCTENQIRNQFEINFFGAIHLIRNFLPHFKNHQEGTIINVSSLCGLTTFPMLSMYHASKWALEGFTESVMYELSPLGIKVKLIEPGGIKENEYNSNVEFSEIEMGEYNELLNKIHKTNWFPSFSHPADIAKVVYQAATDNTNKLRYIVGDDSQQFLSERKKGIEDESCFEYINKIVNGQ